VSAPVAILIDAVNASISTVSYERSQISELLRRNGGKLDRPVTVLLFNGKGLQNIGGPSKDGNLLATAIDKADVTLHPFRRAQGFYGDVDRIQASLNMVAGVAKQHLNRPGREMLIWISPGWPLLPYSNLAPDNQQLQSIFNQIVALSTDLRLAHISIYSLYPNAPGAVDLEWDRYKEYLKGVPSRDKAQIGNLALQVLATQSGGRVLNYTDKYLGSEVADCLAEADEPYYSIHFDPPPAGHKDEFHSLKITVNRSGLTVRTNHGYYNEP
jgi:VWFA-related protein